MKATPSSVRPGLASCLWTGAGLTLTLVTLAHAEEDIRDIHGPKSVLAQSGWLLTGLAAAAVIIALCAWAIWRRRPRSVAPRRLTLSEAALEQLEKTRPLMRPESAREFGISVSEVIRHYIEKRFNVSATQRTTEEFLQALVQGTNEALSRHRALLAQFLQQCDFIKFAGASLALTDLEALFHSARDFVLETRERSGA